MRPLSTLPILKGGFTRGAIPSETNPLEVGDWLTYKDILCWLNQELYHMEIDEPSAWTLVVFTSRECPGGCNLLNVAPH